METVTHRGSTPADPASATGGAWAAIVAASIGCAGFGAVTDLSEKFKPISKLLTFHTPTGDLSGKSTVGVVVWLAAWIILHASWHRRNIRRTGLLTVVSTLLILLAMVLILPPFVDLITGQ